MTQSTNIPLAFALGPASTRRPALGWGISLLVHAVAVAWLWHSPLPRPPMPNANPASRIAVFLVPGVSIVPLRAKAPARTGAPSDPVSPRAAREPSPGLHPPRSRAAPLAPVLSQPPAVVATLPALSAQDEIAKGPEGGMPAFDLAAARASARALVRAERQGPSALSLRQEGKDATTSARIQERFERARRTDCLKGKDSTNLLANVLSLAKDMAANAVDDSGCKW